jgi:hypothetical protein
MNKVTSPRSQSGRTRSQPRIIYQLKITLADIKPPIWRRLEVADGTLLKLHDILQIGIGWDSCHSWAFEINGEQYGEDPEGEMASPRKVKLGQIAQAGVKKFRYVYDFSAYWRHLIQVEGVRDADPKARYPKCVKGSRACPPEDCGGPRGYAALLNALQHPDHEQHEEMWQWVGGDFDPEAFDIDAINRELAMVR